MAVISGIAFWASVTHPNTTFDEDGVWTIDVCQLDSKAQKFIEGLGLSLKNKVDQR